MTFPMSPAGAVQQRVASAFRIAVNSVTTSTLLTMVAADAVMPTSADKAFDQSKSHVIGFIL